MNSAWLIIRGGLEWSEVDETTESEIDGLTGSGIITPLLDRLIKNGHRGGVRNIITRKRGVVVKWGYG